MDRNVTVHEISVVILVLNPTRYTRCSTSHASQAIKAEVGSSKFHWKGGSVISGGTSPTSLFKLDLVTTSSSHIVVENVDLSACDAAMHIIGTMSGLNSTFMMRRCKLPAAWTGNLLNVTPSEPARAEMWNCDSGDTNYRMKIKDWCGDINDETVIVRTGGASADSVPLAWKMATGANNASLAMGGLVSPNIFVRSLAAGVEVTLVAHIVHDSVTALHNGDVCLEVD